MRSCTVFASGLLVRGLRTDRSHTFCGRFRRLICLWVARLCRFLIHDGKTDLFEVQAESFRILLVLEGGLRVVISAKLTRLL